MVSCKTTANAFNACICCHNVSMVCPESITPNASHHGDASPPSCRITQKLKQPCKLTTRYEQINQVIRKRERHSLEALRHIDGANHMRLVEPAPLVLGESYGSRCQPTAAARGKPMTSTNGSGGQSPCGYKMQILPGCHVQAYALT